MGIASSPAAPGADTKRRGLVPSPYTPSPRPLGRAAGAQAPGVERRPGIGIRPLRICPCDSGALRVLGCGRSPDQGMGPHVRPDVRKGFAGGGDQSPPRQHYSPNLSPGGGPVHRGPGQPIPSGSRRWIVFPVGVDASAESGKRRPRHGRLSPSADSLTALRPSPRPLARTPREPSESRPWRRGRPVSFVVAPEPPSSRRRTMLQGPDLPLSPSAEGERLDPPSTPETLSFI